MWVDSMDIQTALLNRQNIPKEETESPFPWKGESGGEGFEMNLRTF